MCRQLLLLPTILTILCLFGFQAQAAKVSKVDKKKVLIQLEGDSAKAGDIFVLIDESGKRKGLVRIRAVKGDRAIGLLGKGRAQAGWSAQVSQGRKRDSTAGSASSPAKSSGSFYWGLMAGATMDSLKVKVDNSGDTVPETWVSLSGTAFSAKGLLDYNMFSQVWFRALVGLEGLSATGKAQAGCSGGKTCEVNIYYLSGDFWARLLFSDSGSFRPWAGGAFSLMFPMSKESTALQEKSITNTSSISIGGGVDWFTSSNFAIPIQVEYILLPKSETVQATAIALRAGVLFSF